VRRIVVTSSQHLSRRAYPWSIAIALVACVAVGPRTFSQSPQPPPSSQRPAPPASAPAAAASAAAPKAELTPDALEVLALERSIEAAVVKGDVAFCDKAFSSDFIFHHGDGWTRGESPGGFRDDKKAFLKRVADKEYLVHDLDKVEIEMHDDLAITSGRYVSLFVPKSSTTQPKLTTIWFERVYEKRDGRWQMLSHRTVHGPIDSPAGIDPTTLVTPEQFKAYVPGLPVVNVPPKNYPPESPEAAEVLAFEKRIGDAIVKGDTAYFDANTVSTLRMVHGDDWTRGAPPALLDTKETFMQRVAKKQYLAHDFDSVKVDMHGDVAITYGRYVAAIAGREKTDRPWFSVWFHRVYQKKGGSWKYVSHRTIHGASHGSKADVSVR
jgi:uncharacterized protein (DUF2267 family)